MSVLACDRKDCDNIMCNRYSSDFGYICYDCFNELVDSQIIDIEQFMNTSKNSKTHVIIPEKVYSNIFDWIEDI